MITINIDPIILHLGPFALAWHSLFVVLAIVVGVWLSGYLITRAGLPTERYQSLALWCVIGGIIGARLVHVIDYWDSYMADPVSILRIWQGGLAVWGAILGGTLAAVIYTRLARLPIAPYADHIASGLILAQAIGRIGDIINGEHISKPTSLPWGVVYTHPNSPGFGLPPVHPAVAYELLMDLLILGILLRLRGRLRPDGAVFLVYLVLYSVGRFFLSFLRLDSNTVFLGLNQPQWISLIVLAVAVPLLVMRRVSLRKAAISGEAPTEATPSDHQA
jgi:phosphatidylglycerol:prolipoprotein diacylglycerol transferase